MSRLHPTLEYFRKDASYTEIERHDIEGVLNRIDKKFFTPEILKIYKSVVTESVEDITYQMVDRNFYYYDINTENKWIRVFEHMEMNIAIKIDVDYMYEDVPILSFPNSLSIYQKDYDGMTLDRFTFKYTVSDKEPTNEEIKDFAEHMALGNVELIKLIDNRVYRL